MPALLQGARRARGALPLDRPKLVRGATGPGTQGDAAADRPGAAPRAPLNPSRCRAPSGASTQVLHASDLPGENLAWTLCIESMGA